MGHKRIKMHFKHKIIQNDKFSLFFIPAKVIALVCWSSFYRKSD